MEYIRYCNICKKVWCYTDDDIRLNSAKRTVSNLTGAMSGVSFIAGSKYNGYELSKVSNNSANEIIDYDKCPHCNSRNFKEISKEEYDDIIKKEEIYNNTIINPNATTEALIKRIEIFIDDDEWKNAEMYCNSILDKEPENGYIWLLKLIIDNKWKIKDNRIDFNNNYIKIEENPLYDKVIKYSNNKETLKIIEQYKKDLIKTTEMFIKNENWETAEIYCNSALDKEPKNGYIWLLKLIIDNKWKIKDNRIDFNNYYIKIEENSLYNKVIKYSEDNKEILKIIEQCKVDINKYYYISAIKKIYEKTIDDYKDAINMFKYIIDYKDSNKYIEICKDKIKELEEKKLKYKKEKNKQKNKKFFLILLCICLLCIILQIIIYFMIDTFTPTIINKDYYETKPYYYIPID